MIAMPAQADPTRAEHAAAARLSLFRAVEVWTVQDDASLLRTSAIYRDAPTLAASLGTLPAGVGLPGQVVEGGIPVVLADIHAVDSADGFVRREAAHADGLTAGVGIPVYRDGAIASVVLFLFAEIGDAAGAIESWRPDPDRNELTLDASHYIGLDRFEMISRYVQFPFGSGLPGEVKEQGTPKLLTGLARNAAFIRAAGAEAEGISIALAWPIIAYGDDTRAVLLMLSSSKTPLARSFQIWEPETPAGDDAVARLVPRRIAAEDCRPFGEAVAAMSVTPGLGLLGRAWESGEAIATTDFADEPDDIRLLAGKFGIEGAVALPVFRGPTLKAVIALWG